MLADRLASQGLTDRPFTEPVQVAGRLLAIQAQDSRAARLAVRARSTGLSFTDVDLALNEKSMVVDWLNRGTLHLVRSEDHHWLHQLTAPRIMTANLKRLEQEGVTDGQAEKGKRVIEEALADQGPMSRKDLRVLLEESDVPTKGQAFVHVLMFCSLRGSIARGPVEDGDQKMVLVEDWLGPRPDFDSESALSELARRYLAGHSHATDRDLANWAGITLGQARNGLGLIASEITEVDGGLLKLKASPDAAGLPGPSMLGAFDPSLHGWKSRDFLIPSAKKRRVVTTNGVFRPTILVEGQVVGIWTMPAKRVQMKPFGDQTPEVLLALEAEKDDVLRYLSKDTAQC